MLKSLSIFTMVLIALIAVQHLFFLTLQIFLWQEDLGRSIFNTTPEEAAVSASLAKQQGLYNGFLAAGLVWGLLRRNAEFIAFFLLCVIAAGVFGAATVSARIFFVQAMPAIIALLLYSRTRPPNA